MESEKVSWYKAVLKAAIIGVLLCIGSAGSNVSVQYLDRKIPDFELNAYRTSISTLLSIIWAVKFEDWKTPKKWKGEWFILIAAATLSISNYAISFNYNSSEENWRKWILAILIILVLVQARCLSIQDRQTYSVVKLKAVSANANT